MSTTTSVPPSSKPPWRFRGATSASFGSVTSLEFDKEVELLWVGDSIGYVSSFSPSIIATQSDDVQWHMYSSFRAFADNSCASIQFLNDGQETLLAFFSPDKMRVTKRGGSTVLQHDINPQFQRRLLMCQTDPSSGSIVFCGDTPGLCRFSLDAPHAYQQVPIDGTVTALKLSDEWLSTGSNAGNVTLRHPTTLQVMDTIRPFVGRINALEGRDNVLLIASSERANASLVKVFDTRKIGEPLITISGIQSSAVTSLRMYSEGGILRALMLTPQGFRVLQLDQVAPIYSSSGLDSGSCSAASVSPNGQCAAIGNDTGHFFALSSLPDTTSFVFNTGTYAAEPKMPKFTSRWAENKDGVIDSGFDYEFPQEDLFSSWPPDNYMVLATEQKFKPLSLRIPVGQPTINAWNVTRGDVYLPDPKDKIGRILLNPYPFNTQLGDDASKVTALLQELKKQQKRSVTRRGDITGYYAKQEEALQVCYSSQPPFDWKSYNGSRDIIGIDNSLPGSWISPLLQCLYLCHPPHYPVRRAFGRHMCKKHHCITCEVAIIFANMTTTAANGASPIVQIASFLRSLPFLPEVQKSGVLIPATNRDDAVAKMHKIQKILLEQFDRDLRLSSEEGNKLANCGDEVDQAIINFFGTEFAATKSIIPPRFYWEVPASATKVDEGLQHLLKQLESYNGDQVQIKRLPPIIVLLLNPEHGNLRPPMSLKFSRPPKEEFNYILCSNVIHLADDAEDPGYFVSHHRQTQEHYVLINDYIVSMPAQEEVLEAHIPAVMSHAVVVTYYALESFRTSKYPPKDTFEVLGPLLLDDKLALTAIPRSPTFRFVSAIKGLEEIQGTDFVALDAEYVVLEWGNKRPDEPEWLRRQRKPHMVLARVSCILSNAPGDERTIIDDYVSTPETVLDYVTQYSGIHEGDLDPEKSDKCITTLKSTYYKLRALADRGCRFVGHGLTQDFRVCNIAIPAQQIVDTLEIYHRPGMRKVSLRFLAYHVLGERVQEDEHDSVEDARTALRLYRKYEEALRLGHFETLLDWVFQKGQDSNWYVPDEPTSTTRTDRRSSPTPSTVPPESPLVPNSPTV